MSARVQEDAAGKLDLTFEDLEASGRLKTSRDRCAFTAFARIGLRNQ